MKEWPVRMGAFAFEISEKRTAHLAGAGESQHKTFDEALTLLEHGVAREAAFHLANGRRRVPRHGMLAAAKKCPRHDRRSIHRSSRFRAWNLLVEQNNLFDQHIFSHRAKSEGFAQVGGTFPQAGVPGRRQMVGFIGELPDQLLARKMSGQGRRVRLDRQGFGSRRIDELEIGGFQASSVPKHDLKTITREVNRAIFVSGRENRGQFAISQFPSPGDQVVFQRAMIFRAASQTGKHGHGDNQTCTFHS